ncbi:TetR/AcrR family transcriptional regulator [Parafrigoribacterium humi]|uniref:TetR/AcrR family transcriptional regulator n=1 Tax=Parafrigoribacterium humi TaxID=3144664 RepID=UPI0032EAA227
MVLGRDARHAAARDEILRACRELAGEHGLSGFTLRQVAAAVGIQAPSLYSYFASKNDIYDALFRSDAEVFDATMAAISSRGTARTRLRAAARAYLEFCVDDPVRHQLLFQRTLPGFEPSAESYAPAIAAWGRMRDAFSEIGIVEARHLDLWTALLAGLAAQQLANDPGGSRWSSLADEAADMFLAHVDDDAR